MSGDGRFEWDAAKADSNWHKHGVAFAYACSVFDDPAAIDVLDNRRVYSEVRFNITGRTTDGVLLHVSYTEREDRIRIISARRAVRHEITRYASKRR